MSVTDSKLLRWAVGALLLTLVFPAVRGFFLDAGIRWFYILTLSFSIAYVFTPVVRTLATRWRILDKPDARKVHRQPTPLMGGIAVYLGILGAIGANAIVGQGMVLVLLGGTVIAAVGIWDDVRPIPPAVKLAGQVLAMGIVMIGGKVLTLFQAGWIGTPVNILLTVLWIVGITNAMNFFDGMDGLATGLSAIIAFFLGIVALQTDQPLLGWFAVAIVGACLGFLPYNFRPNQPASIFLGDTGSSFLGFILACLAVKGEWADNDPIVSLSNPILIFGVLIYDMIHITVSRIATGKVRNLRDWLAYVGKDHMHHRIAALLEGNKGSVLLIFSLSICLGLGAIVLRNARTVDALLLLFQAVIIVVIFTILERKGRSRING